VEMDPVEMDLAEMEKQKRWQAVAFFRNDL
jgi:hypothetical protein